ncbi:MAG TPA: hypothetical protein VJ501_07165 [Burkholderiaceae bacterium]|nr:hypothetical protein [Burkholderiaceae bacterium]
MKPEWGGKTVVCIASGPSLTPVDCARVKIMGYKTLVTNTTFRLCPWADILVGHDARWWRQYGAEVRVAFAGRKLAGQQAAKQYGPEIVNWATVYQNSGALAVSCAVAAGVSKVLLLGYDASPDADGRKHWHEDHPLGLDNCKSIERWGYQFGKLAAEAKAANVEVINASRRTKLDCFPRAVLEDVL